MHACICMYMCVCVCIYTVCVYTERERETERKRRMHSIHPHQSFPPWPPWRLSWPQLPPFCALPKQKKRGHDDVHKQKQDAIETGTQERTPTPGRVSVKPARDPLAPQVCLPTRQSRLQGCTPTRALLPYIRPGSSARPTLPKPRPPKLKTDSCCQPKSQRYMREKQPPAASRLQSARAQICCPVSPQSQPLIQSLNPQLPPCSPGGLPKP